ncbi:MAG: AraC family transcriptional regulator [Gammaproteobacteria bacterium]
MYPSTLSTWAIVIAKAADEAGIDSKNLFERAGADPKLLDDPNARYSYDIMAKLWSILSEEVSDPCFGLKLVKYIQPTTFHAFGYAWFASSTLKDALERYQRYIRLVSNGVEVFFEKNETEYQFNIELKSDIQYDVSYLAADAALAAVIKLCRMSYGEKFSPNTVLMKRPGSDHEQDLINYFGAPITFSSELTGFTFDAAMLEQKLSSANAELAHNNDKIIMAHLAKLDRDDIVNQVKVALVDLLSSGAVNEDMIASELHVSKRSLQRKLSGLGTSYKRVLEETRSSLAKQYVEDSALSITEISYLLGFSETSNFTRAFKRWTGKSPSELRAAA